MGFFVSLRVSVDNVAGRGDSEGLTQGAGSKPAPMSISLPLSAC